MTAPRAVPLNRSNLAERTGHPVPAAPVRIAHLGLGAFHRAHQAWYTDAADPDNAWGIRAFTGRSADAADALAPQDGLYTLIERSADGDRMHIVDAIVDASDGAHPGAITGTVASADVSLVTLTITEAGYTLDANGHPDLDQEPVAADVALLTQQFAQARIDDETVPRTALGRLLLGIEQRRRADAGALAVVPCDNLPGNGELTRDALFSLADLTRSNGLPAYLRESVSFVTTSIDRITPKTTDDDIAAVAEHTGWADRSPVVTEPFSDWVLSGAFPAGRPNWEHAGARFVSDIEPFERRKLWLLNGAHSLLAYAGVARGHKTVADAVSDPTLRETVQEFWDEAVRHLPAEGLQLDAYRAALLERFDNARIQHLLAQIGQDSTTKLRVRIVPVLLAERAAGREAPAAVQALAAWTALARTARLPLDRQALEEFPADAEAAVVALLTHLEPKLVEDPALVSDVVSAAAGIRLH